MLTDQYPCPTPRKHTPTHSTHTHTHKGTQMAPKRTHSAALQPSFVCCQFSSFLAIVPFVPSLSSSQSLSPSQSLLFLSCFFSSLPHCNLASTSAQNALHFCFYLPLFAILFFFHFSASICHAFFPRSLPLNFFLPCHRKHFFYSLVPSCLHATLVTCSKTDFFFFCFPFFCRFFLCVFVLLFCCYPHASPLHVIEQDCRCICICVLHLFAFRICFLVPAIRAVNTVELPKKNSILRKMLIFILHKLKMSYVFCVKVEKIRKY